MRNGLRYEPSRSLANDNHRKSIEKHIAGLPKLQIVNDFADYYDLPRPFPNEWDTRSPSDGMGDGIPDHGERRNGRTENGDEEPSSLRSEEPSSAAAAVSDFCRRTGATWRLDTGVRDWIAEIEREPRYAAADIPYEIRKCADWHVGRKKKPKAPDMSIRNWLERAAADAEERAQPTGKPRGLDRPLQRLP